MAKKVVQLGRIGYDIEYFVQLKNNKRIVPAGILPISGTKGNPEKLENGGVEIDCCSVEITPPPAGTEKDFVGNITSLLKEVRQKYSEVNIIAKASHVFDMQELYNSRYAMTMGCSEDYNAWTSKRNDRPNSNNGLRSCGGHLHIEHGNRNTIRACDLVLGMWSVFSDKDKDRRKLYGRAGAFRQKPYGVEYRVLSNFWCDNTDLMKKVWKLTRLAQNLSTEEVNSCVERFGGAEEIQDIINESRNNKAQRVFSYMMENA